VGVCAGGSGVAVAGIFPGGKDVDGLVALVDATVGSGAVATFPSLERWHPASQAANAPSMWPINVRREMKERKAYFSCKWLSFNG
jgi:hypothetical protein